MNRLKNLLREQKGNDLLSIYYTAGYPALESTLPTARALEKAGVDFIEIGFPYSDPVADGPVIQKSSETALKNGMSLDHLFHQLAGMRREVQLPVILMGYVNPILQFGVERFCQKCREVGVDGLIVPDLPILEFKKEYEALFEQYDLSNIFLITPQTSDERIREIDGLSTSFIYMVSSFSVTGSQLAFDQRVEDYFRRVKALELRSPVIVGFGISDQESFERSVSYTDGAIVGSAFVRHLENDPELRNVETFIRKIRPQQVKPLSE